MGVTGPIIPKTFTPSSTAASHPIDKNQFDEGEIFTCQRTGRMWMHGRAGGGSNTIVRAVVPDIPFTNAGTSVTTSAGMRASTVGSGNAEEAAAEFYGPIKFADSLRIPSLASSASLATDADGKIIVGGGTGAPVDAQYVVLASNGTLTNERVLTAGNHVTVTNSGGLATVDWRYNVSKRTICDSEMNATGNLTINSSGTGAATSYTTIGLHDANRLGVANIQTGTTTTGRSAIGSAALESVELGGGIVRFCAVIKVPTLSDATNTFLVQAGLHDNFSGNPVDGVFFEYTHSVNSGDWTTYVYNNGSTVGGFDTNVAVSASNWYRLEIEVNAAATEILFSIDGTVVQTFTGSIPTGNARRMGFMAQIRKTAGTTARSAYADYVGLTTEVSR